MEYAAFTPFFLWLLMAGASAKHDHDAHGGDHKVDVTVYYESLCDDSIKFFTTQLHPALKNELANHINLTLIPYGKTTTEMPGSNAQFTCHHGPKECEGNKYQACALKLIDGGKNSEKMGFNTVTVDFLNCLMADVKKDDDNTQFPVKECAEKTAVPNFAEISNCAASHVGTEYLSNLGKLTDDLQKPLHSVPTIVFEKKYDEAESALAQTDFTQALCHHIQGKEPACKGSGASVPTAVLGTISVLLFVLCRVV